MHLSSVLRKLSFEYQSKPQNSILWAETLVEMIIIALTKILSDTQEALEKVIRKDLMSQLLAIAFLQRSLVNSFNTHILNIYRNASYNRINTNRERSSVGSIKLRSK